MRTLDQVFASLPQDERAAVDARAQELVTAYSLKQVRRAVAKTQKDVAAATGVGQENVSRLEQRDDMLISTLSGYIDALGGKLRLVADMPSAPVEITLKPGRKMRVRRSKSAGPEPGRRARARVGTPSRNPAGV
jgi:hypothetical protein